MKKLLLLSFASGLLLAQLSAPLPTLAQQQKIKTNAMNKATWYNAPREIQILDERPIVKDFREAPQDPGSIDLPPPPQGSMGGYGGGGAGAGGGDGGVPGATAPMQLGGPNQGYRSAPAQLVPLEHSGFGRHTNIPAGGIHPQGVLPSGASTNLLGKMYKPPTAQGMGAGSPNGLRGRPAGTPIKSYSNNAYGSLAGPSGYGSGSSGSSSERVVRGRLLNAK